MAPYGKEGIRVNKNPLPLLALLLIFWIFHVRRSRKKKREKTQVHRENTHASGPDKKPERGTVLLTKQAGLSPALVSQLSERFIAIDFETTGLSSDTDRIIDIGAVVFENGIPVRRFSTFVNPGIHIPPAATRVNHITDDMVALAPREASAAELFYHFLGDACVGKTILCAHNADFDMRFLSGLLSRSGYSALISYVDTLALSRQYFPELENHKLVTVVSHLGLSTENAHQADADAEMCGHILARILQEDESAAPAVRSSPSCLKEGK